MSRVITTGLCPSASWTVLTARRSGRVQVQEVGQYGDGKLRGHGRKGGPAAGLGVDAERAQSWAAESGWQSSIPSNRQVLVGRVSTPR